MEGQYEYGGVIQIYVQLQRETKKRLDRLTNNAQVNCQLCTSIVKCLGFINFRGIEKEVTEHYVDVIESIRQKKQASIMIDIIQKLQEHVESKKDVHGILPQCFREGQQKYYALKDECLKLISQQESQRLRYSQQLQDYFKKYKISRPLKNLLSQFYEVNREMPSEVEQDYKEISLEEQFIDYEQINIRFTFTKAFLCLFVFLETLMRITPQQQKKREELEAKRTQILDKLQSYEEGKYPLHYLLQLIPKINQSEKNHNVRQSNQILLLFNYLFIVDLLQTNRPKRVIRYNKLRKQIKDSYRSGHNFCLLSRRGWTQSLFKKTQINQNKAIEKQLAYYVGWQNKIKLVRDMIEGLLQLEDIGILQTDLKFANKIQIGQHYCLIDFDLAYKLFYHDDNLKYQNLIHKYHHLNQALNLSKEQLKSKYSQYEQILFETKYTSYEKFAGDILTSLTYKKLMNFLYFPLPTECTNEEHSQRIKQRISKSHVLQLAHIMTPLFDHNPKHPDNHLFFKVEEIEKLIQRAKSPQDVRMQMSTFYHSFNRIVNNFRLAQYDFDSYLQSEEDGNFCSQCGKPQGNQQFIYIFIRKSGQFKYSFLCDKCGEKIAYFSDHETILINKKAPFSKRQKINFDLIKCNNTYKKQKFHPKLFFHSKTMEIQILKYCIMIDIFSQGSQNPSLAQKQVFYRLEYLIQKMLDQKPDRSLEGFLNYYLSYDQKGDFLKEQSYIRNKYNQYPFQSSFEMQQNRHQINILYYNDRLLIKIYEQIIKVFVQNYGRIFQSHRNTILDLMALITEVITKHNELGIDYLKKKSWEIVKSFRQTVKVVGQERIELIRQYHKQAIKYHNEALDNFCQRMAKKISTINSSNKLDKLRQLFKQTQKEFELIQYDKMGIVKQFQKAVIKNKEFLQIFKFKKLVVQQTYAVNNKINYQLIRPILQQNKQLQVELTKIHNLSSSINAFECGTVYFSLLNVQAQIFHVFNNYSKSKKSINTIYFKGIQKDSSQLLQDQNGNSIEPIPQDGDSDYEDIEEKDSDDDGSDWDISQDANNPIFHRLLDLTIERQTTHLKNLLLSNITFSQQACSKLQELLSKATNLHLFGLKYCNNFQSRVLKAVNPDIRSIDFKNIGFNHPFSGLYLQNKVKLANLTIQQMNFNSRLNQIMELSLQSLESLKYLSLKWFTNIKKNQDYLMALWKNSNRKSIEHLTLKTHTISKSAIDLISEMVSLKQLNLKAHFIEMQLSRLLSTLSELKDLTTLKIQERGQFSHVASQDMSQQQLARINLTNQYNGHKQVDSSDNSSCSLVPSHDSSLQDCCDVDYKPNNSTCCDLELDEVLEIISKRYKELAFLRLFLNTGKCFTTKFPTKLCKLQVWKNTINQNTKQSMLRQGAIVYEVIKWP